MPGMTHDEEKPKRWLLRFSVRTFLLIPLLVGAFLAGRLSFKRQLELEFDQRVKKEVVETIDVLAPIPGQMKGIPFPDDKKLEILEELKAQQAADKKQRELPR